MAFVNFHLFLEGVEESYMKATILLRAYRELHSFVVSLLLDNCCNFMFIFVVLFLCRSISFHPEGHCLFSGSQDSLRVCSCTR